MTEMTDEARRQCVEAAIGSATDESERIRIPWQNSTLTLPVVNVRLECVLLNHRSHRIRAQLESHPKAEFIASDPVSAEAQSAIAEILASIEGYEDLRTNLNEEGQRDAGILTAAGLLVNANTRAVALRALGEDYIRCAVLPAGAGEREIDELELRLQVQRDFKQDYTFTNELIFINDYLVTHRKTEAQVALEVRWAASSSQRDVEKGVKRVQEAVRLLELVRYIQTLGGNTLPLTFFDDKRQALLEIDADYQKKMAVDPAGAELFRNARVLGLLANVGYRELRQVDETFMESYFFPYAEESDVLGDHVDELGRNDQQHTSTIEGLDVLDDQPETDDTAAAVADFVNIIATSAGSESVDLPTGTGTERKSREQVVDSIRTAFEQGADQRRRDDKDKDIVRQPLTLLDEVSRLLDRVTTAFVSQRAHPEFDAQGFVTRLAKAERAFDALKNKAEDTIED